jgi:hypothetical protein
VHFAGNEENQRKGQREETVKVDEVRLLSIFRLPGQLAFTVVLSTMFCVQSIKLIELLRQRGGETA